MKDKMFWFGLVVGIVGTLLGFFLADAVWGKTDIVREKVRICHATGSFKNPFVEQEVDAHAVDGIGPADHNRMGHQNGEDIIPSGWWDLDGRNWDTEGQAIWDNDCEVPELVCPVCKECPTPTPVVCEPTPTPVVCKECEETVCPTPIVCEETECECEVCPTPEPTPTPTPEPKVSEDLEKLPDTGSWDLVWFLGLFLLGGLMGWWLKDKK